MMGPTDIEPRPGSRANTIGSNETKPKKKWWKRRPSLNFITIHYIYIVSLTILGSLVLFAGGIPYIDAILFAGGSSTQSGLNTIDLNSIYLYQQIVIMMWACISTPIFINSAVVVVRLYWFEKRFKHLVERARENQRMWVQSRTRSEAKAIPDLGMTEKGVGGRAIKVLHHTTKPNGMTGGKVSMAALHQAEADELHDAKKSNESAASSSTQEVLETAKHGTASMRDTTSVKDMPLKDTASVKDGTLKDTTSVKDAASVEDDATEASVYHTPAYQTPALPAENEVSFSPLHHRAITFPDELPSPHTARNQAAKDSSDVAAHIAIVQRQQQNAKARGGTLRIPGPRDFDRGAGPEEILTPNFSSPHSAVDGVDPELLSRIITGTSDQGNFNADDHPVRRGITINEPANRPQRADTIDTADHRNDNVSVKNGLMRILSPLVPGHHRTSRDHDNRSFITRTVTGLSNTFSRKDTSNAPYLSYAATIGRNSAFVGLSEEQREELGGIEYRALKLLIKILICYYVGFHVLGMVVYLPWIMYTQPWKGIVESDGINPGWWGVFTPASMFNDLGYTLTPDSMISFQMANVVLILGSFLIIIGNTGFPVMLRFIIWCMSKCAIADSPLSQELHFLLDHPRRCFTLLFPSRANWILFGILFILNALDLLFFIILDLNDPVVTDLPPGYRVLNGWFQATSTRTAGFSSVNIAQLHPAVQVSYLIMMYISVLPIAMSVRRTNVYEEASLGFYGAKDTEVDMNDKSFVAQHLRRQLSFDLWYVFLGFFIICIAEGPRLAAMDDPAFSMFAVLFEIVSAYGTVGLSLGYPTNNTSFCAEFSVVSKLVILAMMIRGRHRGLPYALDRAVLLPSEERFLRESEQASHLYGRRSSINDGIVHRKTWAAGDQADSETLLDGVDPMTAGAGGVRRGSRMNRRMSNASGISTGNTRETVRQRGKHIAQLLASGLSAGPTMSKYD